MICPDITSVFVIAFSNFIIDFLKSCKNFVSLTDVHLRTTVPLSCCREAFYSKSPILCASKNSPVKATAACYLKPIRVLKDDASKDKKKTITIFRYKRSVYDCGRGNVIVRSKRSGKKSQTIYQTKPNHVSCSL